MLKRIVGSDNVLSSSVHLYSLDAAIQYRGMPTLAVRPPMTEKVAEIVALANQEKISMVPRGGAPNVVGGVVPVRGGIMLDMTTMTRILWIRSAELRGTVEAGVVHGDLENGLAKVGLSWPPDAGSSESCTIGSLDNASGTRALKRGVRRGSVTT